MTLTQLNAFVLVARLGSVTAAASALGVSEPAVSQALTALRQHLGDQLISRGPAGMTLTPGGSRLLATASQIVVLGAEAHAAVRAAQGAPEQLRIVATSTFAEFVAGPLVEAFTKRFPGSVEVSTGVAVSERAGCAGRQPARRHGHRRRRRPASRPCPSSASRSSSTGWSWSTAGQSRPRGPARQWRWLVDPAGADPGSETGKLLAQLGVPESNIGVFPSQTAAWAAAADGAGVAPAIEHLVSQQLRRGELSLVEVPGLPVEACWYATLLERQQRSSAASALRRFLGTPGGDAADAVSGCRGTAVAIPATGVRHHMELKIGYCPSNLPG